MAIVKTFTCAFCNNNTWHLMKARHGAEAWLQFQCASCGRTDNMAYYESTIDVIEKLIDDDVKGRDSNDVEYDSHEWEHPETKTDEIWAEVYRLYDEVEKYDAFLRLSQDCTRYSVIHQKRTELAELCTDLCFLAERQDAIVRDTRKKS